MCWGPSAYDGKRWAWGVELHAHQVLITGAWSERGLAFLAAMIARLTHIGQDHAIRRALWPDVEVEGTLAELRWHAALRCWLMVHESIPTHDHAWPFIDSRVLSDGQDTVVPGIEDITDIIAARAAIYEAVVGGLVKP